ncbi:LOW QUALITY PROTEIN: hypothetical protein CVT25_003883 [Psilocybe cyanescens]|uniref:N-acetyltransferase domain-containing protein n=1 Tax=Psilocybe cyanescens TaxID=93625 RepID=A0A409XPY0_PSICY|nr:LOW QUALITY PROTEIN: hypothetical protein CVT25_003883 [Psilocybe cyanescens]
MPFTEIRRITALTDKETDAIVDLLVRAFEDSAATKAMSGDNGQLSDLLFRSMVRAGGFAGHLYVLENESQEIVSTALWFAPGTMLFSSHAIAAGGDTFQCYMTLWDSEEQRELGFNEFMRKLDDKTREWWKNEISNSLCIKHTVLAAEFVKEWSPKSPTECWWLSLFGTDPNHQKRGYGTLLLHDGLKKMSSPNLAAFCSTSEENAEFYTKAGFPIRGRTEFPSRFGNFPAFGHSREI